MKKFVLWVLVVSLFMSMNMVFATAVADGVSSNEGDVYYQNREGWPNKHWILMSSEEISTYEANGWKRYTGVLWFDGNNHAVDFSEIDVNNIQNMYNDEYDFHIHYTWLLPASAQNNYREQSVTVGVWNLSPSQAIEYHKTYQLPAINCVGIPTASFMSGWFYENQSSAGPEYSEPVNELAKYRFVRDVYDTYDFNFGSILYLKNGNVAAYSYEEAMRINNSEGFQNELPKWN